MKGTVEMTEEGKSPKTNKGDFPSSLENANCAFPTFPPPLLLSSTQKQHQKQTRKEPSSTISSLPFRLIFGLEKT
jgi:hypothetical protein